jgi:hypothetical protein
MRSAGSLRIGTPPAALDVEGVHGPPVQDGEGVRHQVTALAYGDRLHQQAVPAGPPEAMRNSSRAL